MNQPNELAYTGHIVFMLYFFREKKIEGWRECTLHTVQYLKKTYMCSHYIKKQPTTTLLLV